MIEQDFKKFYESINAELLSVKDRVRAIIGSAHWGMDGVYKEAILKNIIKRFLPKNYSIGTGFVINADRAITKQIDLIIYDDSSPILFKEGDFIIVMAHTVKGIIQVKTKINNWAELKNIIKESNENAHLIKSAVTQEQPIFNGIFAYEVGFEIDASSKEQLNCFFENETNNYARIVNNIALGNKYFLHLSTHLKGSLDAYNLENLSFSYFISNLLTFTDSNPVIFEHHTLYFPFESKEGYKLFSIPRPD